LTAWPFIRRHVEKKYMDVALAALHLVAIGAFARGNIGGIKNRNSA
jgi:hypothetical protein